MGTQHPRGLAARVMTPLLGGLGLLILVCGCGPGPATQGTADASSPDSTAQSANEPTPLPTASIGPGGALLSSAEEPLLADAEPAEGTPEWLIREIQRIRLLPLPGSAMADDDSDDDTATETTETPEQARQRLDALRQVRRERNQQIVKLAMEALPLAHQDAAKEPVFLAAVHHLLDARLQLALQGDTESIDGLYEAAQVFFDKHPTSPAAAEAQLVLVNLAHANARNYAKTEPRWLQEFSRQAQLYATRFPQDAQRCLPQLLAAGRSCELYGMTDEAKACYTLIRTKFPDSPQAVQISGILRRMQLVGQVAEVAGPTLDGNMVQAADYVGKAVIVIFWATHAKPFTDQLPKLQQVTERYKKYCQVLSVCLDSEEIAIDRFLEQTALTWPVIFHPEPDKQGWNAPVAAYYGVSSLPTIWVIDPTGKVADTTLTPDTFEPRLREILLQHFQPGGDKSASNRPAEAAN